MLILTGNGHLTRDVELCTTRSAKARGDRLGRRRGERVGQGLTADRVAELPVGIVDLDVAAHALDATAELIGAGDQRYGFRALRRSRVALLLGLPAALGAFARHPDRRGAGLRVTVLTP